MGVQDLSVGTDAAISLGEILMLNICRIILLFEFSAIDRRGLPTVDQR